MPVRLWSGSGFLFFAAVACPIARPAFHHYLALRVAFFAVLSVYISSPVARSTIHQFLACTPARLTVFLHFASPHNWAYAQVSVASKIPIVGL